jgi:putative Ca2+/H+ antiporter (TMEM165/GDT1 family)
LEQEVGVGPPLFSYTVFVFAFVLIALAEIGDKTQFVVIALAMRTRRMGTVAIGATLGISIVVVLGVTVGTVLDLLIPIDFIDLGGAVVFILLGLITLVQSFRHAEERAPSDSSPIEKGGKKKGSVLISSAIGVGLMEFGDKTQVATITLSATYDAPLSVALGAILAEGALMMIGAFVGAKLLTRIRKDLIDYLSSSLFILVGISMILV